MSEIVFSELIERNRNAVADMDGGRALLDQKFTVFRRPGKVCFATSVLVCGVPKVRGPDGYLIRNTDKRYYYWRTTDSYGFRRNSAGHVQPYECHRAWDAPRSVHWNHKQPRAPWQLLDPQERDMGFKAAEEFQWNVYSEFGIEKPQDLYPMMNTFGLIHPWTIPNTLKVGFRSDDMTALARYAFGQKRSTPELVKAVAGTDPYMVAYAQQFKGLVPDSSLITFMKDNHFDSEMEEKFRPHTPSLRKGLLRYPSMAPILIDVRLDEDDLHRIGRVALHNQFHTHFNMAERQGYTTWKEMVR